MWREFTESIDTIIRPLMDEKHIDFTMTIHTEAPCIRTDRLRFNQISFNRCQTPEIHARGRQHRGGERTIEAGMNYHLSSPSKRSSCIRCSHSISTFLRRPYTSTYHAQNDQYVPQLSAALFSSA